MEITPSRLCSLVLAAINALIVFHFSPNDPALEPIAGNFFVVLAPLVFIWFSEIIGNITGPAGNGAYIDVKTPGWMIAGLGWILMLGPIAVLILHLFHQRSIPLREQAVTRKNRLQSPTLRRAPFSPMLRALF